MGARPDRHRWLWPLPLALLSLLILALLLQGKLQSAQQVLRQEYQLQYQALVRRRQDHHWLQQYYRNYETLRQQQSADSHRLQWLDSLRTAAGRSGIPAMRYSLEARQPEEQSLWRRTVMQLQLGLNHEYQLPALLERLAELANGRFRVRSCRLRRQNTETQLRRKARNLEAACELHWYSVTLREDSE